MTEVVALDGEIAARWAIVRDLGSVDEVLPPDILHRLANATLDDDDQLVRVALRALVVVIPTRLELEEALAEPASPGRSRDAIVSSP